MQRINKIVTMKWAGMLEATSIHLKTGGLTSSFRTDNRETEARSAGNTVLQNFG